MKEDLKTNDYKMNPMLIAITAEGLEPTSLVAEKLVRTPFLIFYETEKNTFESLRNPYANLFGGAGIQTSQLIIEKNVDAVITIEIGLNPLRLLNSANIKVYSCSKKQVIEAVKDFMENKLSTVDQEPIMNFGRKRHMRKGRKWNNNF